MLLFSCELQKFCEILREHPHQTKVAPLWVRCR
uniref:Uncharacterized protein n=1 Tax=Setaria viridis TaxID=4556 RepID=A0A4U6UZF5_SETVI|nr:hypothetical protein SEVIR_4G074001v2 [Setaria viridis]